MAPLIGPLCLGSSPKKPLHPSQSSPQSHRSLLPNISRLHTHPGTVGSAYQNTFAHHLATQHTALCAPLIGGAGIYTQTKFLGETASLSFCRAPCLPTATVYNLKAISMWKIALVTKVHK